jgi:hypothetical protein
LIFRMAVVWVLALLVWVFWPVTAADFVIDDYVFIATSRMVENPLAAFWQSHFYEPYYFRPLGVLSWWVATRALGLDYAAHSLVNLAIHAASVGLLAVLLRDLGVRKWAALAGVVLFALAPFSLTATLWPSNRFDLLAVLFLLCAAISLSRVLNGDEGRGGRWWFALALTTLAACWSKELAFPAATMLAICALFYSGARAPVRVGAFALMGAVIGGAFFWRHSIVAQPYAAVGADPMAAFLNGAQAWANTAPTFAALALGESGVSIAAWLAVAALGFALCFPVQRPQRRFGDAPPPLAPSMRFVVAAALVVFIVSLVQAPLAGVFSRMLDGGSLGTITFGRFYYAPMAAFAVFAAAVLSRARASRLLSGVVIVCAVVLGVQQRALSTEFARWTQAEIRPVSLAATQIVDASASVKTGSPPCIYVFLGTQGKHPWFRMFADVTVKARTEIPLGAWRCYMMTESTPWIFAFPAHLTVADIPLLPVPDVVGAKPDSMWGTIRYRYRLMPPDIRAMPNTSFFDWQNGKFVDVTADVQSGERVVKTHGWGF